VAIIRFLLLSLKESIPYVRGYVDETSIFFKKNPQKHKNEKKR